MSFWLFPLKEKGIDGLLVGVSRCYTYVILQNMKTSCYGDVRLGGRRYGECRWW